MIAKRLVSLAAVSAAALWGGSALAADFTLDLSGLVANYTTETGFNCCGAHFDPSFLTLSGLDNDNAITVSQGDTITANITLDGPLTIPGSVSRTNIALFLFGSDFPNISTGTDNATTTFFDGGNQVGQFFTGTGTSGSIASTLDIFPPNNGPFTFDSATFSFTISNLSQSATLNSSELDFTRVANLPAVPEPASWALMLVGFGGIGAVLRSLGRRAFA